MGRDLDGVESVQEVCFSVNDNNKVAAMKGKLISLIGPPSKLFVVTRNLQVALINL